LETFYEATPNLLERSAIALGFFDGVHPGHQVVIGKAVAEAKAMGITPAAVTFKDHPRALTRGQAPLLLTDIDERLQYFADLGVEAALVLSFTEDLCRLSPREYVENMLVRAMGAKAISVGYNHHFGKDREGDPALLSVLGKEFDFAVFVAPMVFVEELEVSSTRIREHVGNCQMDLAKQLLSRPYAVIGEVVRGEGRGRKIGFPTANIAHHPFKMLPGRGVYAGFARLEDERVLPCVVNIGYKPTFKDKVAGQTTTEDMTVEVHILDFDEDLYGKRLDVRFLKHLRAEMKFAGVDALIAQITADCAVARDYLSSVESRQPA